MKNNRILFIILLITCLYSCNQKTNKDSRQFENIVEITALSKDSKELTLSTQNYYVFESIGKELFDEKGYFIDENEESKSIVKAIVRSNVRSVFGKYDANELINMDKSEIETQIQNLSNSMKFETNNVTEFNIRFNLILVHKLNIITAE